MQMHHKGNDYLTYSVVLIRVWPNISWTAFGNRASQVALVVKNLPANAGDIRDMGLISGSGRYPGEGNGNPLRYSCLENSMDRGARRTTVHGVTKSWTWQTGWACMYTFENGIFTVSFAKLRPLSSLTGSQHILFYLILFVLSSLTIYMYMYTVFTLILFIHSTKTELLHVPDAMLDSEWSRWGLKFVEHLR